MAKQKVLRAVRRNRIHNIVVNAATATSALAAPVASPTKPTGNIIELTGEPLYRFIFGATDADDETVNYQIIGWYLCQMPGSVADTWIGVVLAKGAYTAGSLAIAGITTGFFADTITDSVSTQTSLVSTVANNVAMITVDTHNANFLEVETDLGTAASAYAWAIPGDFSR